MKGKFDAYVLRPLAKKFQNWIADRSTARDFTVIEFIQLVQNVSYITIVGTRHFVADNLSLINIKL